MEELRYGIGIDIAKDKFDCCLSSIDHAQEIRIKTQRSFENNKKGIDAFDTRIQKNVKLPLPVTFLMEATGVYYEQLAWHLHTNQYAVSVILPGKAKKYKEPLGLKSKNDRIDARGLSRMSCEQKHTKWAPASNNLYILRLLTRQIQQLSEQSTVLSNQLHALTYGMIRDKEVEKMKKKQIDLLKAQKEHLQQRVEDTIAADPVLKSKFDNICRIKGLGLQAVAVIIAETAGFAAFENLAQLVSYAGYDVVENSSGTHAGKTRISKKGNGRIRRALHFPGLNVVRHKVKPFVGLYDRVYGRCKIKMKGYVAVQKKMLCLIYTLWTKDVAFDENYAEKKTFRDIEPEPSLATADGEQAENPQKEQPPILETTPSNPDEYLKPIKASKVTPLHGGVTQDRHPSTPRRLPSLAENKIT